jgi:hypothetical protein
MARRGRPTLFTPVNREKILTAIRLGAADMICGATAGVEYSTIRKWVERGERETKGEYFDFALALKAAKGERVNRWLAMIEKAAQIGTWQAAAWKLERLYSELYGRTVQRIEQVGPDGKVVKPETHVHLTVDLSKLKDDELELYRRLAERGAVESGAGSPPGGSGNPPA